jgi:hypothetical protein
MDSIVPNQLKYLGAINLVACHAAVEVPLQLALEDLLTLHAQLLAQEAVEP